MTGSVFMIAPAATPQGVPEKAALDALASPQVHARLQVVGFVPLGLTGKHAGANYDAVFPLQEKLLQDLNIKLN